MRISDWSSDVCSSDLHALADTRDGLPVAYRVGLVDTLEDVDDGAAWRRWREGYGSSVAACRKAENRLHPVAPAKAGAHEPRRLDRQSVVEGKRWDVGVDPGVSRNIKKKKRTKK